MTDNVSQFPIQNSREAKDVGAVEMLRELIREIEAGEVRAQSVLIFTMHDEPTGEGSNVSVDGHWRRAGPHFNRHSETLGWLRYFEDFFIRDMRADS